LCAPPSTLKARPPRHQTLGGLGVWTFVDFILILIGKFNDKQGQALAR
jgi:hypothetical protein